MKRVDLYDLNPARQDVIDLRSLLAPRAAAGKRVLSSIQVPQGPPHRHSGPPNGPGESKLLPDMRQKNNLLIKKW